ncbi:DUF3460 family protein [Paraburkholderia sp. BL23I1N1]|uniref:DUF3460 family protein n=1 Tax=Paraburkholderia sp. BL23I1N1 TaxID=1938802 RepID=UPI000E754B94|nr:DUF3460 family protein [Paraburkholderia sp. BL23I1N1]
MGLFAYPPKREPFATAGNYRSDITSFLDELKKKHVDLEERQRKGRVLLWDCEPIDLDERRANASSTVQFLRNSSL